MDSHLCFETLELLFNGNPVTIPQIAMYVRSLAPQQENLYDNIANYVESLREIGLVTNKDGFFQATTNTNPQVHDNIRASLLASQPIRMAAGSSVNPTVILPNEPEPEPEPKTVRRRRSRTRAKGRGAKRGHAHVEEEETIPNAKRQRGGAANRGKSGRRGRGRGRARK